MTQHSSQCNLISIKFFTDSEENLLLLAVIIGYRQHDGTGASRVEQIEAYEMEAFLFL